MSPSPSTDAADAAGSVTKRSVSVGAPTGWGAVAPPRALSGEGVCAAVLDDETLCIRPGKWRKWNAGALSVSATVMFHIGWRSWGRQARDAALRADPTRFGTWLRQARAMRLLGRRAEGLVCLVNAERLLELGDGDVERLQDETRRRRAAKWSRLARSWVTYSNREAAERAQNRAVEIAPERPGLWMLLANFRQHKGDYDGVLSAHRKACEAAPNAAGAEESLARAYMMLGREATAFDIAPKLRPSTAIEHDVSSAPPKLPPTPPLRAHQESPPAKEAQSPLDQDAPVVLDLTDLLNFVSRLRFVSGIQRVQAELALALLQRRGRHRVYPAIYDSRHGRWKLADPDAVIALIRGVRRRSIYGKRHIDKLIAAVRRARGVDFARLERPVLFTPGATWSDWRYLLSVRAAKRRQGMRFVPFVHDCIPLILPETCSADVPPAYSRWLAGVSELADAYVVNSERTGADLRAMLALAVDRDAKIGVAQLNGRTSLCRRPTKPRLDAPVFDNLSRRGFVICVGSLEPRKNHLLLFKAWRMLVERHGDRAPALVVVGRNGWREEDAFAYLDANRSLRDVVYLLPDVDDAELAWLYRRARFSICASLYEGWGMPISESLDAGLPVLAARNSALTEAGGYAATYFTSGDAEDLVSKVEAWAFDDAALAAARRLAEEAPLRAWTEVAEDAMRMLNRVARSPFDSRRLAPLLTPGRRYDFTDRAYGPDLVAQEASLHGQAWLGRDLEGLWTATGAPARLCMRVDGRKQAKGVTLELSGPEDRPVTLTATLSAADKADAPEECVTLQLSPCEMASITLPLEAFPPGLCDWLFEISLTVEDHDASEETGREVGRRGVAVSGVRVIGYP